MPIFIKNKNASSYIDLKAKSEIISKIISEKISKTANN